MHPLSVLCLMGAGMFLGLTYPGAPIPLHWVFLAGPLAVAGMYIEVLDK